MEPRLRYHLWWTALIVLIALVAACMFRYAPVDPNNVWDRWTHQMCYVSLAAGRKPFCYSALDSTIRQRP